VARKHIALQDCTVIQNLRNLKPAHTVQNFLFGLSGSDLDIQETAYSLTVLTEAAGARGLDGEMELIKADLIELKKKAYAWAIENSAREAAERTRQLGVLNEGDDVANGNGDGTKEEVEGGAKTDVNAIACAVLPEEVTANVAPSNQSGSRAVGDTSVDTIVINPPVKHRGICKECGLGVFTDQPRRKGLEGTYVHDTCFSGFSQNVTT
jgi:hypothetical protein